MKRWTPAAAVLALLVLGGSATIFEVGDGTITEAKLHADVVAQLGGGGGLTGFSADPDYIPDTLYVSVPLRAMGTNGTILSSYGSSNFERITFIDGGGAAVYAYYTITLPEGAVGPRTNGVEVTCVVSSGGSSGNDHDLRIGILGRGENEFLGDGNYTKVITSHSVGTVNSRMFATTTAFGAAVLASTDFQVHIKVEESTDTGTDDTWLSGISVKIW